MWVPDTLPCRVPVAGRSLGEQRGRCKRGSQAGTRATARLEAEGYTQLSADVTPPNLDEPAVPVFKGRNTAEILRSRFH